MEVHRIVITVIDFDQLGADEVCDVLQNANYSNDCIDPFIVECRTEDIGDWHDDHPLNKPDLCDAEIARLFT